MTDLKDYQNFYLLTDVLLLSDMLENFYGLDPAHNYTSPGLSWQAAFKLTEVELDLFTFYY